MASRTGVRPISISTESRPSLSGMPVTMSMKISLSRSWRKARSAREVCSQGA